MQLPVLHGERSARHPLRGNVLAVRIGRNEGQHAAGTGRANIEGAVFPRAADAGTVGLHRLQRRPPGARRPGTAFHRPIREASVVRRHASRSFLTFNGGT